MRTAVGLFIEYHDQGNRNAAAKWLEATPAWQIDAMWDEVRPRCLYRLQSAVVRRPANALNLETIKPSDRCRLQPPPYWPTETSALRWLGSGGSVLVFEPCERKTCPLRHAKPIAEGLA